MIYIMLDHNRNLVQTQYSPIYKGENLNQKIIFLVPTRIDDIEVVSTTLYLCYVRADGTPNIVILENTGEKYNDYYLQYIIPVRCDMTMFAGEICIWLQLYTGDATDPVIAISDESTLRVLDTESGLDNISKTNPVTALYQIQDILTKNMDELNENMKAIEDVSSDISAVKSDVEELRDRLDNIEFTGGGGSSFDIDSETLFVKDGSLSVKTVDAPILDDPRPITSGAVYNEFSKAVALLKTI